MPQRLKLQENKLIQPISLAHLWVFHTLPWSPETSKFLSEMCQVCPKNKLLMVTKAVMCLEVTQCMAPPCRNLRSPRFSTQTKRSSRDAVSSSRRNSFGSTCRSGAPHAMCDSYITRATNDGSALVMVDTTHYTYLFMVIQTGCIYQAMVIYLPTGCSLGLWMVMVDTTCLLKGFWGGTTHQVSSN